ncbi:MAG: metalloregulator ArsR/SmtB family transcription factor [Hyphomonas sp.]
MTLPEDRTLDRLFGALSDPTRRAILARLVEGEATVSELTEPFPISMPAISRHLGILEDADLIVRVRDGQHRRVRLNRAAFDRGEAWFRNYARFWEQGFDRLARHLESKDPT